MWEAVRPDWAAMSRKMGTGAEGLGAGDFVSIRRDGTFAAGPVGLWGALWADSRPVKAIPKIIICPTRMHSDCSAIGSSAAVSAAVVRGPSPPRRGRDAPGTASRTPGVTGSAVVGVMERISARFIPRHEPGVVFEQVVQVLGIGGKRLTRIRIRAHVAEWERVNRIAAVGVEVHIFFVSVGDEEIVAYPARRQGGQIRRIEIERNFIARSKDDKFVVDRVEQRSHIAIARVSAGWPRVWTGGAGLFVNVFHIARRLVFDLQREAVEIQFGAQERDGRQAGTLIMDRILARFLASPADQDV